MFTRSLNLDEGSVDEDVQAIADEYRYPIVTFTVKDKVVAYLSIAFGVIGLVVFLYFYIAPLCKPQEKATPSKKRAHVKPVSNKRQLYGLDNNSSFLSNGSVEAQPLVPEKLISRDSLGLTKARPTAIPVKAKPSLPKVSSPLRSGSDPSPFSNMTASPFDGRPLRGNILTSTPAKTSRSAPNSPSVGDYSASRSPTFVEFDRWSSPSSSRRTKSPLGSPCSSLQVNSSLRSPSPSVSRSANTAHAMIPPRTSSLDAVRSTGTSLKYIEQQGHHKVIPSNPRRTKDVEILSPSPRYANSIVPRDVRESFKLPGGPLIFNQVEPQKKANAENRRPSASPSPNRSQTSPKIQSLHVRETVLSRASTYTRGLVVGAPTKSRQAGTELQFEMVKGKRI